MDKLKSILNHYITRYIIAVFCILKGLALKGSPITLFAGFIFMVIGWISVYSAFKDSYILKKIMKELDTEKEQEQEEEKEKE